VLTRPVKKFIADNNFQRSVHYVSSAFNNYGSVTTRIRWGGQWLYLA